MFSLFVIFPRNTLKLTVPVVGRQLFLSLKARIPPDIVIAVGIIFPLAALDKPGVLVRSVIDHQIEQHLHSQLMRPVQHFFELFKRPVIGMDILVVGDVIAVIRVGRGIDRAEPDAVHAQAFNIFQLVIDAVQIADPVSVTVAEAADPDLIE